MNKGHVRRRCPKPVAGKCETGRCGHAYEYRFSHDARVFTGSAPTEREARAAMTKAMAKAVDGQLLTRAQQREAEAAAKAEQERAARELEQRVRLGDYLDQWLERRGNIKPATRRGYADIISNHIRPRIGDVPLADLTRRHVRELLEDLALPDERGRVRTAATLARVRSLLSGALERAVDDELVPANVARGVDLPETAGKGRGRLRHVFSPVQLQEFLTRADPTLYGPVLRFIAGTGVRRGEAVGLLWSDVDLDAGVATIRRSLTKVRADYLLDTTKTENERQVPLLPEIVAMLREVRRAQAEAALRLGRERYNPQGFVFVREDGTHLRPDSVTQVTQDITTAMGVPQLHVHSLRHSLGSAAIDAGVDVKVVADLLGHKTTATTQNFYQHTSAEAARSGAEAIAAWRSTAGSVAAAVASGGDER